MGSIKQEGKSRRETNRTEAQEVFKNTHREKTNMRGQRTNQPDE